MVVTWRSHVKGEKGRLEWAVEQERKRIARELHDNVAQELAFIVGHSRWLMLSFPNERALADIESAAASALDSSRSMIYGLREATSHTLGSAVVRRARALAGREGLDLKVDVTEDLVATADVEDCLLSILREAISNAARHAHATTLEISLRIKGGLIELRISDDGRGFNSKLVALSEAGGFGLLSMKEHAEELRGQLTLTSTPGGGTTIVAAVPEADRQTA